MLALYHRSHKDEVTERNRMVRCWNCDYSQLVVHGMSDRCFPWKPKHPTMPLWVCYNVLERLGALKHGHKPYSRGENQTGLKTDWMYRQRSPRSEAQSSGWVVEPSRDIEHTGGQRPDCKVFRGKDAKGRNDSKYYLQIVKNTSVRIL